MKAKAYTTKRSHVGLLFSMAAECLVLLAHSQTGLSVSELGLLTGVSTLILRNTTLKPLQPFLGLDLDTTEPLALCHACLAQAILTMPPCLARASQTRFEWHAGKNNNWPLRSLWRCAATGVVYCCCSLLHRLFLSLPSHEQTQDERSRLETTSVPKSVLQLSESSQVGGGRVWKGHND
jgi:hypothetical protein